MQRPQRNRRRSSALPLVIFGASLGAGGAMGCHDEPGKRSRDSATSTPSTAPAEVKPATSAASRVQPDPRAATRNVLLRLTVDPLSLEPVVTRMPSDKEGASYGERICAHYEYVVPSVGRIEQERKDAARWHLLSSEPNVFASPDELRPLDDLQVARWFRVTGGAFAGHFMVRGHDRRERLSSSTIVCEEAASVTPKVVADCAAHPK